MSDSRKQSLAILMRIADFIENLPEEHLADLEAGTALLTLIPAGSPEPLQRRVVAPRTAPRTTKQPTVDLAAVAETVRSAETREAATAVLKPLRKDPDLKEIAVLLNVTGLGSLPKDRLVDAIVEATVGSRLDFQAIQGSATLSY